MFLDSARYGNDWFCTWVFLGNRVVGGCSITVINTNPTNVFATVRVVGGNDGGDVVVVRGNGSIRGEGYPGTMANGYVGYGPCYRVAAKFSKTNTFSSNGLSLSCRINNGLPRLVNRSLTRRAVGCASGVCLRFNTSARVRNVNGARRIGRVHGQTVRTKLGLISYPVHRLNARGTRSLCFSVRGCLVTRNISVVFSDRYDSLVLSNRGYLNIHLRGNRRVCTTSAIITANEENTS